MIVAGMAVRRVRRRASSRSGGGGLLVRRQCDKGTLDAWHFLDDALGGEPHRLQLFGAIGRDGDGEIDLAVGDEDVGDHAELDDIVLEIGSTHGLQRFENLFLGDVGHSTLTASCRSQIVETEAFAKQNHREENPARQKSAGENWQSVAAIKSAGLSP